MEESYNESNITEEEVGNTILEISNSEPNTEPLFNADLWPASHRFRLNIKHDNGTAVMVLVLVFVLVMELALVLVLVLVQFQFLVQDLARLVVLLLLKFSFSRE